MGGGVSSLPEQFTLAEAKELAGDKWRWQWAERFPRYPGARITRAEAVRCWNKAEPEAAAPEP